MTQSSVPILDKPGAGLPFYEWAVANYLIMPILLRVTSVKQALADLQQEIAQIETATAKLSQSQLSERQLIPRLTGLEDSSRFWSVAMTLEHLIIVQTSGIKLIQSLSAGVSPRGKASTAAVKPSENVDSSEIVASFLSVSKKYVEVASSLDLETHKDVTFSHPWFGELNAKEWVIFAPLHMRIHRKQITKILNKI